MIIAVFDAQMIVSELWLTRGRFLWQLLPVTHRIPNFFMINDEPRLGSRVETIC
jgi:hypothetical protein